MFKGFFKKKKDEPLFEAEQRDIADENPVLEEEQPAADRSAIAQLQPEEEPAENLSVEEPMENLMVEQKPEQEPEQTEEQTTQQPAENGFFARLKQGLSKTRNSFSGKMEAVFKAFQKVDEELFEELEEALIMADVGVDTSLYIIDRLRVLTKERKVTDSAEVRGLIQEIVADILSAQDHTLHLDGKPAVVMVIGVNGVGKTTTIGKLAARFRGDGKKVILGAGDTFRAAAAEQLNVWAERVGVDIISHQEGADPAAVVFDTISAAKSRGSDIIILDTAGRLHNKKNLMDELNKIYRVIARELPDSSREVLLVLDATTGQNAVSQAKLFQEAAELSGIVLTKLDGTAKGGIVIAIGQELGLPVKLIGVGEGMDDLQVFDAAAFTSALFGE